MAACSTRMIAIVVLVFGCGDPKHQTADAASPDSPIDAPPIGANLVTLTTMSCGSIESQGTCTATFSSPAFIAYRNGNGLWLTPQRLAVGRYALYVTNEFEWIIVCTGANGFNAEQRGASFADGASQMGFCFAGGNPATTVVVTGQMIQAGTLSMHDVATSATPNWNFNLAIPPGTHDLVGVANNYILIRRNQAITAAATLATVDVSQGAAMTSVPLTITNLGSDTLATSLALFLANDVAVIAGNSTTLEAPPVSVLTANDFQVLNVWATTASTRRSVGASAPGKTTFTPTTFTLMPVLTGVTYNQMSGALSASWASLPSYSDLGMSVFAGSGSPTATLPNQEVSVTKNWVDATGATNLTFDTSAPGYNPLWKVDLTGPYVREFWADGSGRTNVDEAVNGATLRPVSPRHHIRFDETTTRSRLRPL